MSFSATLYNCSDDPRKLNKKLEGGTAIAYIEPTESCDILNPVFILNYNADYTTKNYIVVGAPFNRSYFITDMKIDIAKKIVITCAVDVLQTYKSEIEKISTTIVRNENPNSNLAAPYLPDPQYNIEAGYEYFYKNFDADPLTPSGGWYVLSWVGDEYSIVYIRLDSKPSDWDTAWGKYYYRLSNGEYISCFTNFPTEAPDYNVIVNSFGGVYEPSF